MRAQTAASQPSAAITSRVVRTRPIVGKICVTACVCRTSARAVIASAAKTIQSSPALQAREQEIVSRYTRDLAAMLAVEMGVRPDDAEPAGVAAALMGVHRAVVAFIRAEVLTGRRGPSLARAMRAQAVRAFARLEAGLGDYATRR